MPFELPPLPYDYAALEPYLSADTLRFHHDKHHKTYVDTLNELIAGTEFEGKSLEDIIRAAARDEKHKKIFNNAAQVWNHTVQWNCMKPSGGGSPPREIADKIDQAFGGFDEFKKKFKTAAVDQFGSGWAWLVLQKGKMDVVTTSNADAAVHRWPRRPHDLRCVGARLLSGLPEPPSRLRRNVPGPSGELGLRARAHARADSGLARICLKAAAPGAARFASCGARGRAC